MKMSSYFNTLQIYMYMFKILLAIHHEIYRWLIRDPRQIELITLFRVDVVTEGKEM